MKDKIVLWGKNEKEEKILVAIELVEKENQVKIHRFPASSVSEDFHKQLMNEWKAGKEVPFPADVKTIDRPLSVTDDLLPETIRVDRTDLVSRAKAEWHFIVLSSKLYELYSSELSDIKEKVDKLGTYSSAIWEEMKGFWSKVQQQVYDKNLFREHANSLRQSSNEVFDTLKQMRKKVDQEFKSESKKHLESFNNQVNEIKAKIDAGNSLQPLFEELKKLQSGFNNIKFTRDDRNKVWNAIDSAFKTLKEKKYGKGGQPDPKNVLARLKSRYEGLLKAIDRMKGSIERDLREKNGQSQRAGRAMGQLEAQLREARVAMIDERINSKQVKLKDMIATKADLEKRMAKEEARAKKRAEQAEMDAKKQEKKEEIKQKIAAETKAAVDPAEAEKLKKAAEQIAESKKSKSSSEKSTSDDSQEESIMDKIEDTIENVAEVLEDAVEDLKDKAKEVIEAVKNAASEATENIQTAMKEEEE